MSEKINDGGPAFPLKGPLTSDCLGMSLRDYFAAKALAGMELTAEDNMGIGSFWYSASRLAKRAYSIADAMLKERESHG